ncbi:MAG: diguanylate cyclase [Desulfovibrionaceae bacterium]|nr:diguanylate cyclase [Desulfovibrionaceae bacterium]
MKQYSFHLNSPNDISSIDLRSWSNAPSAVLVQILSGWEEAEILTLAAHVRRFLPEAVVLGTTTAGEIMHGELSLRTTVINCMVFSKTEVHVERIDFDTQTAVDGARKLLEQCLAKKNKLAGIELLIARNNVNTYAFLAALSPCPSDVPIFGGVAGLTDGKQHFVFYEDVIVHDGVIAVVFESQDLHIHVCTSQGWCPLGPWFRITAMQSENIISHIDKRPAMLVYEKYLGFTREDFANENLAFPLFLERSGHRMLRLPALCTQEGALVLRADCRVGERVRLAYGNADEILDASISTQKTLLPWAPEAILLFNCMSRRFYLRDATHQELKPFQDTAPCVGYYTEGEVGRAEDGDLSLLNMTLVSASLREGPLLDIPHQRITPPSNTKELTPTMMFLRHLTHFIAVSSAELEELATTDKLTGLHNRGEIESIIKKELIERRCFSAIMLDLDNFKAINDTFGHDEGDRVLAWTASVMKQNIRSADAAGRWGGEEFLILLPGAPLIAAQKVAERIRTKLRQGYTLPDKRKVTASMGVAEFSDSISFREVYRILDAALYQAKENGKDCFCVANPQNRE